MGALQGSRTKTKDAAVAVSGSSVITKLVEMPGDLSEEQMEAYISTEADQYIPYPLEEVALDFDIQGPSAKNPENVETRVSVLEIAGLNPRVVDVEAYTMERAFELVREQLEDQDEQVVAIIDVGATMTAMACPLKRLAWLKSRVVFLMIMRPKF